MGILKKSGSWRYVTHGKRVSFGAEIYSTGETPQEAKLHDGMSEKNRAWLNFIDLAIILQVDVQIAWNRVPKKYMDFVWHTILDCLDKYAVNGCFVQMPLGHPRCKIINESYNEDVVILGEWVYKQIHGRPYRQKHLEKKKVCTKCNIGYLEYDKSFNKHMCYICDINWGDDDVENDENWNHIKENINMPSQILSN